MSFLTRCLALALALASTSMPAVAQNGGPFAPRLTVNGSAITNWELDQRMRMLTLFGTAGDVQKLATDALIDERLQVTAAESMGLAATPEALRAGMEEFASRANMSADQFIAALAQGGVAEESFRDFVEAGMMWREVVRGRFGPRVQVTENDIDRTLANLKEAPGVRVLLSEIVIPASMGPAAASSLAGRIRQQVRSEEDFAAAAREHSSAPSASSGGQRDWQPLGALPEAVASVVPRLRSGQTSPVINVDGTLYLYQLRGIENTEVQRATTNTVEYALVALPAGRDPATEAARIRAEVDTCDDLYGVFKNASEQQIVRETMQEGQIPAEYSMALASLDAGESTLVNRGGQPQFVMLCSRIPFFANAPSREMVRNQIVGQRLSTFANGYLEELRSDAIIREF